MNNPEQAKQIQVNARPEELQGRYANAISVTAQERDVVIDFMANCNTGNQPGQLVSRIYLNHFTAQNLVDVIQKTLKGWEDKRYNKSE